MTALYVPTGMRSFPYKLADAAGLPDALRPLALAALPADELVSSIFVVPPQSFLKNWGGQRYVPEQALLFGRRGVLHVQAESGQTSAPQATYLPADGLVSARLSILLLYGCLELAGEVNGAPVIFLVEFNTVGDRLLWPALRQLVQAAWGTTRLKVDPNPPVQVILTRLQQQSFKFNNGLQIHALQPAEKPLGFAFQPALWRRRWGLFRWQVSATTLLTLTDRQLILLEEDVGKHEKHGWIFNFYPLACIVGIVCRPVEQGQEFIFSLQRGQATAERRVILAPEAALKWVDLWQHYRHETGADESVLANITQE